MMHGPLQMLSSSLIFSIFSDNDFTARVLYACAGTMLVMLPIFMRDIIGRFGSASASLLLSISPTLLYFSRFARNDILMAFFTTIIIICFWKYVQKGKTRYLYITSFVISLCFGTKESSYLISAIIIGYCFLTIYLKSIQQLKITKWSVYSEMSEMSFWRIFYTSSINFKKILIKTTQNNDYNRHASILFLLISITLPQWAAFLGLLQNSFLFKWSNMILLSDNPANPIGMPEGGGKLIAILMTFILLIISILIGKKWNWPVWWKCAGIYYFSWAAIYTTFFTNITEGISKGIWQSLGYWIIQQGEARGDQPLFYYVFSSIIYEYLPLILSIAAISYFWKIKKMFGINFFLSYWAISTFLIYTIASEKMPWLLVNITIPLIFLSSRFLEEVFQKLNTRKKITGKQIIILTTIIILAILTLSTSIRATFHNSDIPKEMLIYTQTSPDLKTVSDRINDFEYTSKDSISILIDSTSGFTWPWAWYMRNKTNVAYRDMSKNHEQIDFHSDVLIVHESNNSKVSEILLGEYQDPIKFPHRWWFPESTYREIKFSQLPEYFSNPEKFGKAIKYWIFGNGIEKYIGTENAYIYSKINLDGMNLIGETIINGNQ